MLVVVAVKRALQVLMNDVRGNRLRRQGTGGTTCVSVPVLATLRMVSSPRGPDHTPAVEPAGVHLAARFLRLNVRDRLS